MYEPLFNLEYIRQTWYLILAFGILGIAKESVKLIDGSYTQRVMIVTIINFVIILLTNANKRETTKFVSIYTKIMNLFLIIFMIFN